MGNAFQRVTDSIQKMQSSLESQYAECLKDYLEYCYHAGKDPNKTLVVKFTKRHRHAIAELVKLKGQCSVMLQEMKVPDTEPKDISEGTVLS